ncbi:hypothetical protein EZV62_026416 [Acer yangbiense]|uniref:Gnk2-homologous domain-containing protein n=1 Tax=Acer yangbiense TaxID=1000413 RepID=A0A5C7GS42_9ROSI|nr:hypothetical protein EZV62_026416 [Acer yangbiense]
MSTLAFTCSGSICLLYLLFFVSMVMSQTTFPFSHCPRGSNNTASTKFRDNLNNLFNGKLYDERGNSLSYNTTDGEIPDRVYSNYICRFDFSPETCRNCVSNATKNIMEQCNGTQEAVLWYPTCMVRYSYRNFFSTLELVPMLYAWNAGNITRPGQFAIILNETFNDLIARAPLNPSKYAIHEGNISDFERLYSLAQCTEDLSTEDCGACLKAAFDRVTADSVQGKQGGRVLIPSCFVRYELFRFYGDPYVVGSPGPISQPNAYFAEEEINNQEAPITPMSERRMGDERSYDILRRDHQNQTESQDFPVFPLNITSGDPPYNICTNSNNYATDSPFKNNLSNLLRVLSLNTSVTKFSSFYTGDNSDRVYGLYMCFNYNYTTSVDCKNCIATTASQHIVRYCPNEKEAIVWEDSCLLRYSSEDFFGKLDVKGNIPKANSQNVSDPERYRSVVNRSLSTLTKQAAYNPVNNMSATGVESFTKTETLYALVQCTRDLSGDDCSSCLQTATREILSCCYFLRGARVHSRSCFLRYELYDFVNGASESSVSSGNQAKGKGSERKIWMIIILTIVAAFVLSGLLACTVYHLTKKKGIRKTGGDY